MVYTVLGREGKMGKLKQQPQQASFERSWR
jgi:hypothetical protein